MRYSIVFLLLVSSLKSYSNVADATIKETIEFIISKMNGKEIIYLKDGKTHSDFNISYKFDYSTNVLTMFKTGTLKGNTNELVIKIPLKNLNPAKVRLNENVISNHNTFTDRVDLDIYLETNEKLTKITRIEKYGNNSVTKMLNSTLLPIPLSVRAKHKGVGDELVKAFIQAIKLSGKKVEKN